MKKTFFCAKCAKAEIKKRLQMHFKFIVQPLVRSSCCTYANPTSQPRPFTTHNNNSNYNIINNNNNNIINNNNNINSINNNTTININTRQKGFK